MPQARQCCGDRHGIARLPRRRCCLLGEGILCIHVGIKHSKAIAAARMVWGMALLVACDCIESLCGQNHCECLKGRKPVMRWGIQIRIARQNQWRIPMLPCGRNENWSGYMRQYCFGIHRLLAVCSISALYHHIVEGCEFYAVSCLNFTDTFCKSG